MAEVTLDHAIENIDSSLVKNRREGLADLKHILRHNQKNPRLRSLGDDTFHRIFETLFRNTLKERSNLLQAKTKTTRTSAANKLSDIASALRQTIDSGVRSLKLKTVQAVIHHVVDTIHYPDGGLCEPIAPDYIKCLRALFEYTAHVEHLSADWVYVVTFCVDCIKSASTEADEENALSETAFTASTTLSSTFQSSRSVNGDLTGSQTARSAIRVVADESIACLRLLTAVPNAPLEAKASDILWTLVEHLKRSAKAARSHQDAFQAMNHVIQWARTDNVALTQQVAACFPRLIRQLWSSKSPATENMLISLLLVQPYLDQLCRERPATVLRSDLEGVLQVVQEEYAARKERKMLHMDDLRLGINDHSNMVPGKIATPLLALSSPQTRSDAESNWLLLSILASIYNMLIVAGGRPAIRNGASDANELESRPRKRPRTDDRFLTLLNAITSDTPKVTDDELKSRLCALQVLTMFVQKTSLAPERIKQAVEVVSASCNEEDSNLASWSYLALASCASQESATGEELITTWSSVWQLASRAISNISTCRAASYALYIMLEAGLVPQSCVLSLIQSVTQGMELSGPCLLSDSVSLLLRRILQVAEQTNLGELNATADGVARWFTHHFTPSKVDDKAYVANATTYQPHEVSALAFACLGQQAHVQHGCHSNVWHDPGRAWLFCKDSEAVVTYLLLGSHQEFSTNLALKPGNPPTQSTPAATSTVQRGALLLNHIRDELAQAMDAWEAAMQDRGPQLGVDAFTMLCKATCVAGCVAECLAHVHGETQAQLRQQVEKLLNTIKHFVSSARCDDDNADAFLSVISSTLSLGPASHATMPGPMPTCEVLLCSIVAHALARRQQVKSQIQNEDPMDLDEAFDSQDSHHTEASSELIEFASEDEMSYSWTALRAGLALYTTAVMAVQNESKDDNGSQTASGDVVDYLLSQSDIEILASRHVIAALPAIGLEFKETDVLRLLEYLAGPLTKKYTYKRSETLLTTIIVVMRSLKRIWLERSNESLYELGLDLYDWFIGAVLPGAAISVNAQRQLSSLLLDICEVDANYAAANESSVKTSLLGLIQRRSIVVQFHLASNISKLFGFVSPTEHEHLFDNVQSNLPKDVGWTEGIAMRLLFFADLASSWNRLLRRCVYYIFESAGRLTSSIPYATHCIGKLAGALPVRSPRRLFSLFASQLLHTWLENHAIDALPYQAFGFSSLAELLTMNQSEVCAQLVMRGSKAGLDTLVKSARMMHRDVVKRSFAKCCAYAISFDTVAIQTPADKASCTQRLKDLVGKEEYSELIQSRLPTVIGYIFLATQQEELHGDWLQKRSGYAGAFQALLEIKGYSCSQRALPDSQQPNFRSKYLCDQLERACRRAGLDKDQLWSLPTFTLVARMLIDSFDDSMGPLHSCLVIRRLRLLISLAGETAYKGIALEMLIHSLRPFATDGECADDTLGILQYLFHHGRADLKENTAFSTGTVLLLVIQLRRYVNAWQEQGTQDDRGTRTIQTMLAFTDWLVAYYGNSLGNTDLPYHKALTQSLSNLRLPGSARRDRPESSLLLFLLNQWSSKSAICLKSDITEALEALASNFEGMLPIQEDCLGEDTVAFQYSRALWEVLCETKLSESFTVWAAQVLGRAYASSGARPLPTKDTSGLRGLVGSGISESQAIIAKEWLNVLFSRKRIEAGLAEYTLRIMWSTENDDAEEAAALDEMLPAKAFDAFREGTFGYEPPALSQPNPPSSNDGDLRGALAHSNAVPIEDWAAHLAVTLCTWAPPNMTVVSALAPLVQHVPGLALKLLPSILHILLYKEVQQASTLRSELSAAMSTCFSETSQSSVVKQQFFLRLLLYLRSQPYPNESTRAERLRWLDVDYLAAAKAGARCEMPTSSLLLAESAAPVADTSRRKSGRASLSQLEPSSPPEELLLTIYRQLEEPDSFYGVEQPASLQSVLNRLDHEADGYRSLMFRSAQMDCHMRQSHRVSDEDAAGMVQSLTTLNFNSLAFALLRNGLDTSQRSSEQMLSAARTLQQWDIPVPGRPTGDAAVTFALLKGLSRADDLQTVIQQRQSAIIDHTQDGVCHNRTSTPPHSWFGALASLTEVGDMLCCSNEADMLSRWRVLQGRHEWMHMARFEEVNAILNNRQTFFSVLSQNDKLQGLLQVSARQCRRLEAEALLDNSRLSREHSRLQEALAATTSLSDMAEIFTSAGLKVSAAVKSETASVLWMAGEASASVRMLRETLAMPSMDKQDIGVGRAGLLAQLGHQLVNARLAKPDEILNACLKPAIDHLKGKLDGKDSGKVHFEFATFCDKELQSPANIESLMRISKLRQGKQEELEAIRQEFKRNKNRGDGVELKKSWDTAQRWLKIDTDEEDRLTKQRKSYVKQSLQNYLLALTASDEHDICVLRFFALWLENSNDQEANAAVREYLPRVPSWKFVLLMNQLMSRIEAESTGFQSALHALLVRICLQHPHHSIHHLYAASRKPSSAADPAAASRYRAASQINDQLGKDKQRSDLIRRIWEADGLYKILAEFKPPKDKSMKFQLSHHEQAARVQRKVPDLRLPPVTLDLPLSPNGDYSNVPKVVGYEPRGSLMSGLSVPKLLTCRASDGQYYKQLFKSGNDDLRQDAIMEQVFEEVSKMLRNHKATRQRDLKVRTYKVIPLSNRCGIIEFVPNSIPLNDYLRPAHRKYYPKDMSDGEAREMISDAAGLSTDNRVKEFRKVCEKMHPVLRHFFFEHFDDPEEWFEKRTAYARTTASISILGHVLGLGDRHNSNILLDKGTGEVVHIDLGVAFEAGRVLPIPELVPFRLTRDIVDGMGSTGTEGVFRRCCEFTLEAVRDDRDSIMTLLNVLRYDPLYNWSVSPLRAKRMQEAQQTGRNPSVDGESSSKPGQEDGEADRALSVVEKKLSKTLSVAAAVNELIQQATDERNLATLFNGWAAFY